MASHGILHQTSCAYTPQQIGWLSSKIDISFKQLTLLIHVKVPLYFWGDVILTSCYLINHMPFLVLDNKIPHFILLSHEPFHPLSLKVFWSTCFVHNFSLVL